MAKWLPAAMIILAGLAAWGVDAYREHVKAQAGREQLEQMQRHTEKTRAETDLLECQMKHGPTWAAHCARELREVLELSRAE